MSSSYKQMYFTRFKKIFSYLTRILYLKDCKRNGMKYGSSFRIMSNVNFGSEPYLITIGNNVTISIGVLFSTHDGGAFVLRNLDEFKNKNINTFGKIIIGNNVFIGANSIILPHVTIGNNVVIGANSLVSKDVVSNSVYAGIPAKQIMTIDEYANKTYLNNKVKIK